MAFPSTKELRVRSRYCETFGSITIKHFEIKFLKKVFAMLYRPHNAMVGADNS